MGCRTRLKRGVEKTRENLCDLLFWGPGRFTLSLPYYFHNLPSKVGAPYNDIALINHSWPAITRAQVLRSYLFYVGGVSALTDRGLGCFFLFRPAHPLRSVPVLVWVIRSLYCGTGHVFCVLGPGLGWSLRTSSRLHPPRSVPGCGLGNLATHSGTGLSFFRVIFFFFLPIPPRLEPGAICVFWLLRLWHRTV